MRNMSRGKRARDSVGSVALPSECNPIKRRAGSHLGIPSMFNNAKNDPCNDDVDSDWDMTSSTVESTSTALSELHSTSSVSPSPQEFSSPPISQSCSVSETVTEQCPSGKGICFGMVRLKLHSNDDI